MGHQIVLVHGLKSSDRPTYDSSANVGGLLVSNVIVMTDFGSWKQ